MGSRGARGDCSNLLWKTTKEEQEEEEEATTACKQRLDGADAAVAVVFRRTGQERRTNTTGSRLFSADLFWLDSRLVKHGGTQLPVTNLIECGRQRVPPITSHVLSPFAKGFQWALCQMDTQDSPTGFRKWSMWRIEKKILISWSVLLIPKIKKNKIAEICSSLCWLKLSSGAAGRTQVKTRECWSGGWTENLPGSCRCGDRRNRQHLKNRHSPESAGCCVVSSWVNVFTPSPLAFAFLFLHQLSSPVSTTLFLYIFILPFPDLLNDIWTLSR